MRSAFFILVLGVVGYGLWSYYGGSPDFAKVAPAQPLHTRTAVHSEASPAAATADPATGGPSLKSIAVFKGPTLTNAKVKSVTRTGIVFLCDQGLIEVPFENLAPEFGEYYTPNIVADETVLPVVASPTPKPKVQSKVEQSAAQDAQDQLNFTRNRMSLKERIKSDEQVMDQWYQQSSFRNPAITESQFMTTKADRDAAILQLAELEANGPAH